MLAAQADTAGALEAAREGVSHFPTERVELQLVRASVGALHEVRAGGTITLHCIPLLRAHAVVL